MQYTLASDGYSAAVAAIGAELLSIKSPDGEQYMWSGDAAYWAGRAPILFPVIGLLKDGGYDLDGQRYSMPKHGLVRRKAWAVASHTDDSLVMCTGADDETRGHYPFEFELRVEFSLRANRLRIGYTVINHGETQMPFSLGSHPAFALPLRAGEGLDQWSVRFSVAETLDRQWLDGGLISAAPERNYLDRARQITLGDSLFDDDALMFFGVQSTRLDLVHKSRGRRLSLHTGGAPDLGIWAVPGAPYVCLEPWYGYNDPVDASGDINAKPGIIQLAAKGRFETAITVELATGDAPD